jgi:hypothetical protein
VMSGCGQPSPESAVARQALQPLGVPIVGAGQTTEGQDQRAAIGAQIGDLLVRCAKGAVREGDVLELDGGEPAIGVKRVPKGPEVGELLPIARDDVGS